MKDAGVLTVCSLTNTAQAGDMPKEELTAVATAYFEERTVGYSRYFTALGANERVDMMIRTWRMPEARAGMYAVLSSSENDGQYRIAQVQHLLDDDGLKVTDLSLTRLETFYELEEEEDDNTSDQTENDP